MRKATERRAPVLRGWGFRWRWVVPVLLCAVGQCLGDARAVLTNATLTVHPRMYYLNRHFTSPNHRQISLAAGGWADFASGEWMGLRMGLTPYTSQRLAGDDEHDGASLLQEGQKGYTVLGQAYLSWSGWNTRIVLYRQLIETPLLNSYDVKMTPVTFEAYTLINTPITNLTLTVSQVERIKPWTASSFERFAEAGGYAETDDGITLAGAVWNPAGWTLQAWEYYAHNMANSVYAQIDAQGEADSGAVGWTLSAQGLHQQDVGAANAGAFETGMGGLLGGLSWKGWTFNLGGTVTDNGADIFNPWASYPGYTSLMEEDCNVAGEKAWMVGLAYDFSRLGLDGWSAFTDHSQAWTPTAGSFGNPEQYETNLTVDFQPGGGWTGLHIRGRAAVVRNSLSMNGTDYEDYRLIVNYERTW